MNFNKAVIIIWPIGLFLLIPAFLACSQSKSIIKKSYGYYIFRLPGNIPVDMNGEPLPGFRGDTVQTIYIETSVKDIKWDSAWKQNNAYIIISTPVNEAKIDVGLPKNGDQHIFIEAKEGNYLWRLDLLLIDAGINPPFKLNGDEVILRGNYKGKIIEHKVSNLVELYTPDSV
ncbi:MAG TPA: hypothetical protein PKC72_08100 [Chitinophagaceae bacterium]|nr:hypothetical protein [Chitinophagaceae bacterium]